jgi:ABC-2 type transport system ATP-binding protein
VPDPAAAAAVLTAAGFRTSPAGRSAGDTALLVHAVAQPGELTRLLAGHGHYLEELTPVAADLESAFLELTGDAA